MLLRNKIEKTDIVEINMMIEVYERMVIVYENWKEKHGEYDYVDERIQYLHNMLAEYLIAREMMLDQD